MHRIGYALALAAALAPGAARASDPVGGYMIVDKVILSPSQDPTTAQVWGSFSLATARGGKRYSDPQRGYLYYEAPSGKEDVCRKEWNDLKKAAGTGQVLGFGTSADVKAQGKVRRSDEKVERPDPYPVGNGLVKVDLDQDYKPVSALASFPTPQTPGDGDLVPAGQVTFVIRNAVSPTRAKAEYLFELVGENGDKEHATVPAGDKETKWTPRMKVTAGKKYTWHVRAIKERWEGPIASSVFVVKGKQ